MAAQTASLGAQRLAASTEKPPLCRRPSPPGSRRAQRLAASTEKPLAEQASRKAASFGAQRLAASTEKPHVAWSEDNPTRLVLNALRHQRKNHKEFAAGVKIIYECSTPCGINGKTTLRLASQSTANSGAQRLAASTEKPPQHTPKTANLRTVLNALRHQRKNHQSEIDSIAFL